MIVQAISLLDDLDKELNTYAMRVKEWYGWHFPELVRIVNENIVYSRVVLHLGNRKNIDNVDMTDVLDEVTADVLKKACVTSMGYDVSDDDVLHMQDLATQVIEITEYREELYEYLKNRMRAIAPNLTILVGELVGARLIAHAGSLINLSKQPASTIQILGAEKALFRALKSKNATPKYGLIYHASVVGQTQPKSKGKISRILANKAALAVRVDALGDESSTQIGVESLQHVSARIEELDGRRPTFSMPEGIPIKKYEKPDGQKSYNVAEDVVMTDAAAPEVEVSKKEKKDKKDKKDKKKKRKRSHGGDEVEPSKKKRKKSKKKDE
jgi:nucleolar protein 58